MAGDWIPIQTDLSRRREVLSISKQTGRSRYEVVGLLIEFWGWVSGETDVDAIVDVYVDTLPSLVGGDHEFWVAVMRAGWLKSTETGICIPNFDRWMSQGAKTRLRKNLRQKKWRNEQSKSSQNVDASVDTQASTTEQNRTEYKKNTPNPLKGDLVCVYCGVESKIVDWKFQMDHFLPIARGGGDESENLVVSCEVCNQIKSSRVFKTIEAAREHIHNILWTKNRKRYIEPRKVCFQGNPPEGFDGKSTRRPAIEAWAIAVKLAQHQSKYAQHDLERWKQLRDLCPEDVRKFAEDFGLKSIQEGKAEIVRGQFVKLWNDSS